MRNVVLLGCGFLGKWLLKKLENDNFQVFPTSREPDKNEYIKTHPNKIRFDLNDNSTYKNIPDNSEIIWLFPASPLDKVTEFYNLINSKSIIRIVFGTTSSYISKTGIISESFPLDMSQQRVQGENFLLSKGAVILQAAGIYNQEKHPFNWLNKGLIKNSNKIVNLIHVDDISTIISKVIISDLKNQRLNVSDGVKYWWKDIWKFGKESGQVFVELPSELEVENRFISNKKLKTFLGDYKFESFK
jgi:nucleoside-diphosphate-sugar epimerase